MLYNGERIVFLTNSAGNNWTSTCKKIRKKNLDTDLTSFRRISSKWIRTKNKIQNPKVPRINIGGNFLGDPTYGDDFFRGNTKGMIHEKK